MAGKGVVTKWERVRKNNHWFDALYNACALGHFAGVRLLEPVRPTKTFQRVGGQQEKEKKRPWIDRDRWHGFRRRDG